MNGDIDDLESQLRTALQAKSNAVTAPMLRRPPIVAGSRLSPSDSDLATAEPEFDPNRSGVHVLDLAALTATDPGRRRPARWFAPALAAAAVIALAVGAGVLANANRAHHPAPNPPATGVRSPLPSPSQPAPTPSTGTTVSGPATAPYLGAGKTGARDNVPWSVVNSGWRLVQPSTDSGPAGTLYLYDPAGGRYLITDQLPGLAYLEAWSPDGQRAMFRFGDGSDTTRFRQLNLRTGQLDAGFSQFQGEFVSYTQPHGLAVIVSGSVQRAQRLLRYGADGTLQLAYPPTFAGQSLNTSSVLYTADGSQFLGQVGNQAALLTNGGQLARRYPAPDPADYACYPVRWWDQDAFLESCSVTRTDGLGSISKLYLQPTAGGTPTALFDQSAVTGMGYRGGWQLSNGDVLLARASGCGSGGYDVLHPDGTVVALRLPAGVIAPGTIENMSGDLATFRVVRGCGDPGKNVSLIDYNMVTGATSTLLTTGGTVISYPGS